MRIRAQASQTWITALIIALLLVAVVGGCGKKGEEAATEGENAVAAAGEAPSGEEGAPGTGPSSEGPGAGGPGGEAGGAAAGPAPTAPTQIPAAPAPTPEQQALVDEAVVILRGMLTRNVPPPPPGEEPVKAAGKGAPAGAPAGPAGGPSGPAAPAPGSSSASVRDPFHATDYRYAQAGGPDEPGAEGGAPAGPGAPGGTGGPAAKAAAPASMPPVALAITIKKVCQKTRGVDLNGQKFFHEYWYFMAKNLLEKDVMGKYADFPLVQLTWAAQTRSDWEGYLWHWALRKMLEQKDYAGLEEVGANVAKARTALATLRSICNYGLLMHDVDQTKMGRIIWPTVEHVANCVQLAFGNPNYDPATIQRDETKRSRLMVEIFDNYVVWGHNWWWERSRNWSYLARVSTNLPAYKCPSCGHKLTRTHAMWRCPECGKGVQADLPGTDVVEPYRFPGSRYADRQYQSYALYDPVTGRTGDGKYTLKRGWNSPTYARVQQGMRNAQRIQKLSESIFAGSIPTQADMAAYQSWKRATPVIERIPELHQMELEAHETRLHNAAVPGTDRRN
jgi:hypothetical protein